MHFSCIELNRKLNVRSSKEMNDSSIAALHSGISANQKIIKLKNKGMNEITVVGMSALDKVKSRRKHSMMVRHLD